MRVLAIDTALAAAALTDETFALYVLQKARFHALLATMAGSPLLARQLEKAKALPFASPNGFVRAQSVGPGARASANRRCRRARWDAARHQTASEPDW